MKYKRNPKATVKLMADEPFQVKQTSGALYIEGFANKATIDRGNEVIATDAWELDNFKANPVILFNHGFDTLGATPVGKAVDVRPTDKGLFIKVRMSNSQAPGIKMVRDLVEEKILKAFSVGFDPKEVVPAEVDGKSIKRITKAELFEVSIVAIPMNQDSLFELSEKSLTTKSLHQIKQEFLTAKGAKEALEIENRFVDSLDRKATLEKVASEVGVELSALLDMLVGDAPITPAVSAAFAKFLGNEDAKSGKSADGKDDKEAAKEGAEKTEGSGEGSGKEGEGEEDADSEDEGGDLKGDFQDCVSAKIPKLIEEGMEQDQAVAAAISKCQDEMKLSLTAESKTAAYAASFAAMDSWDGESALAVEISGGLEVKQVGEADQSQQPPTTPIKTENNPDDFGSPYLDAVKQTNVLLGALINEIQKLSAKVEGLAKVEVEESEEEESPESDNVDGDKSIAIDYAIKRMEDLSTRLAKLGC